jgi:hypothetical protein
MRVYLVTDLTGSARVCLVLATSGERARIRAGELFDVQPERETLHVYLITASVDYEIAVEIGGPGSDADEDS